MNKSNYSSIFTSLFGHLELLQNNNRIISSELIDQEVRNTIEASKEKFSELGIELEVHEDDVTRLKFDLGHAFSVSIGEEAIILPNPDLHPWFHTKKTEIKWKRWNAYKRMLTKKGRVKEIIDENEKVIDAVLDYSGDPTTEGAWARKGLVMGNVQSGKTQNYLGLINKAFDCGYKVIIVLGGHQNELRNQTQERIDEGVIGRESKSLAEASSKRPAPIGVGQFGAENVITATSTLADFSSHSVEVFGVELNGKEPVIFTIKKHTSIMKSLYEWILEHHFLDPENGKKLSVPLMLIDDEADYASINTKHHKDDITATNEFIRKLLSLFHRSTYVGYTATPFANIFIDPDEGSYNDQDDLFPSDFMIKLPVPDDYMGQNFFFPETPKNENWNASENAVVVIKDHYSIFGLKSKDSLEHLPASLYEAIRAFLLAVSLRSLRGEKRTHNTMMVNVSHLKDHQNKLEFLIKEYLNEILSSLTSFSGLGHVEARKIKALADIELTYNKVFSVSEEYKDVFSNLLSSAGKVKVQALNQSSKKAGLNYKLHEENGLSVIAIGGHKLSRGLTLEGLSISYFARNSKAYDTLMQMCRWFGYRPSYQDLCKVYLPFESLKWYSFIASVIRDLYEDLDRMAIDEMRPSSFGMKVREHPGSMIVTAKNKIGAATSEVRSQSLWGQVQRRFHFCDSVEKNQRNLAYCEKFLSNLAVVPNKLSEVGSSGILFESFSYDDLIQFIKSIDLKQDSIGNRALVKHLEAMKNREGFGKPRVALFNQKNTGNSKWLSALSADEIEFIDTPYLFCGHQLNLPKRALGKNREYYSVPSVHLGNSDDEIFFVADEDEQKSIRNSCGKKKANSNDYLGAKSRNFPGLIIYLFAAAHVEENSSESSAVKACLIHGKIPTLGYSISIPKIDSLELYSQSEIRKLNLKTRHSYKLNKVHMRENLLIDFDEESDDE